MERRNYGNSSREAGRLFQSSGKTLFTKERFNCRNQLEGESAEQYITALYGFIENCEYDPLKEELGAGAETSNGRGINSGKSEDCSTPEGNHSRTAKHPRRYQEGSNFSGSCSQIASSSSTLLTSPCDSIPFSFSWRSNGTVLWHRVHEIVHRLLA